MYHLLEWDILVVEIDGWRDCRRCRHGRSDGGCGRSAAALTLAHELDLVHDDLELRAALAVLLPRAVTQFALDRDLVALGEEAAHGLGTSAEHGAVHEVWVVLPLAGLRVAAAVVHGDAEGEHLRASCGDAQLGVAGKVAGDADAVDAHFDNPFIGCWRLRWVGTSRRPGHWVCYLEPSEPSIVVLSLPNDVGILLDDRTERIKENALIAGLGVIGEADDIPIIVIVDPET